MPFCLSRALGLLPLSLLLILATPAKAQTLPPYAGTRCSHFATQQEAQWHYYMGTAPTDFYLCIKSKQGLDLVD